MRLLIEAVDDNAAARVADAVKRATGVTPVVEIVPPASLPTTEFKSRRVEDRRPAPDAFLAELTP